MGRSTHRPVIQHNSHPHPLFFFPSPSETSCAGCSNPITGAQTYTCNPCNYSLHTSCTTLPPTLSHPSHASHDLTLLFSPAYPEGSFHCDACGKPGTGFSYHCKECGVDVHALCGLLPAAFLHPSHFHPLSLKFSSPYEGENYMCDLCEGTGQPGHWMYRCSIGCEFDAHLGCVVVAAPVRGQRFQLLVTGSPVQEPQTKARGLLGPSQSMPNQAVLPGNGHPDQGQLQRSMGPRQAISNPATVPGNLQMVQGQLGRPNMLMQQPMSPAARPGKQKPSATNGIGQKLLHGAAQGLSQGVAQQIGKVLVQSVLGTGNNNNNNAGSRPASGSGGRNNHTYNANANAYGGGNNQMYNTDATSYGGGNNQMYNTDATGYGGGNNQMYNTDATGYGGGYDQTYDTFTAADYAQWESTEADVICDWAADYYDPSTDASAFDSAY